MRGFLERGLSLNQDGKIFVQVQKVNGWKASLGGVHLQKIENQVHNILLKQKRGGKLWLCNLQIQRGSICPHFEINDEPSATFDKVQLSPVLGGSQQTRVPSSWPRGCRGQAVTQFHRQMFIN